MVIGKEKDRIRQEGDEFSDQNRKEKSSLGNEKNGLRQDGEE